VKNLLKNSYQPTRLPSVVTSSHWIVGHGLGGLSVFCKNAENN